MSEPLQFTGNFDRNGTPIAVGDLVRVNHFKTRSRRQIYLYKKVVVINSRIQLVDIRDLGIKPTAECHKCLVQDAGGSIEVMDGDSCTHPLDGTLICWWERKRLPAFKKNNK